MWCDGELLMLLQLNHGTALQLNCSTALPQCVKVFWNSCLHYVIVFWNNCLHFFFSFHTFIQLLYSRDIRAGCGHVREHITLMSRCQVVELFLLEYVTLTTTVTTVTTVTITTITITSITITTVAITTITVTTVTVTTVTINKLINFSYKIWVTKF